MYFRHFRKLAVLTAFCFCCNVTGCQRLFYGTMYETEDSLSDMFNIRVNNAMLTDDNSGKRIETEISGQAEELFAQLNSLRESSESTETVLHGNLFAVNFEKGYRDYTYCYYGDGMWAYIAGSKAAKFFQAADSEASQRLADLLCTDAAMPVILSGHDEDEKEEFTADMSQVSTQSKLSADTSDHNREVLYFYLDDRTERIYYYILEDEGIYYEEESSQRTDADINGSPYYQSLDEYEYFGNAKEAYYRPNMYPIFYPAEEFTGEYQPEFFAEKITDQYTFSYSFPVATADQTLTCEIFRNTEETAGILLDEMDKPYAAWFLNADGMRIMHNIYCDNEELGLSYMFEDARRNSPEAAAQREADSQKTEEDWRKEDVENLGFFDLGGTIEEGQSIPDSQVVQRYLDELSSEESFTFESWCIGDFRYEYSFLTTDGKDSYHYENVSSHDNSFDYEYTDLRIGDYVYYGDEENGYSRYLNPEPEINDVLYVLPDAFRPGREMTFQRAYYGKLDGEEFEIEEWLLGTHKAVFFCRDGELVAFKYTVFDAMRYFYVVRYERSADTKMLQAPENFTEHLED